MFKTYMCMFAHISFEWICIFGYAFLYLLSHGYACLYLLHNELVLAR